MAKQQPLERFRNLETQKVWAARVGTNAHKVMRRGVAEERYERVQPEARGKGRSGKSEQGDTRTVEEVLAWVGEDPERAREALEAETAKGDKARSTLVDKLTELAE